MTDQNKSDKQNDQLDHVSGGGHLGGTRFGQQPGDAKLKPGNATKDKAAPKDEKSS